MTKDDFKRVVREKMKEYGFSARKGRYYKIIDDDYLIGVELDHSQYGNDYYVEFGVVYLPDEEKMPFRGIFDWNERFKFTKSEDSELSECHPGFYYCDYKTVLDYFEYDQHSEERLAYELKVNYEKCIVPLYDKEFVLNEYRNDWVLFRNLLYDDVKKICRLAGLDYDEVVRIRDGNVTKWPL